MCRLLGVVANRSRDFRLCLTDAPRSLYFLSCEHCDGWGVAVHHRQRGWTLHKHPAAAQRDPFFEEVAESAEGEVLVAHIRKRTVGAITVENTHPFRTGRWMFAHNGTIDDLAYLRASLSPRRLQTLRGDTDSELLFAYLLGKFDEHGIEDSTPWPRVNSVLSASVEQLARRANLGAINFLLSDGAIIYAYRQGRPLFLLERSAAAAGGTAGTRSCVVVASEPLTDEPWRPVPEGTLLAISQTRPVAVLRNGGAAAGAAVARACA